MIPFLQNLDGQVFYFINRTLANPIGDLIFPLLNHAAPFVPLFIGLIAWLAYIHSPRIWRVAFTVILAVLIGDSLIFNPLKKAVAHPRPAASLKDVRILASGATGGYSFPSSHTANAFTVAAVLSLFFWRKKRIFFGCALFIGIARVYVGVHYPSDILGSGLIGAAFGTLFFFAARKSWRFVENHSDLAGFSLFDVSRSVNRTSRLSIFLPWTILLLLQILRLVWAATTNLDVPPDTASLWVLTTDPDIRRGPIAFLASCWFGLFGTSILSLWAIPWTMQSIWIGVLAWAQSKRHDHSIWGVVFLAAVLPIVSQLSFLGSPEQFLAESDWNVSTRFQTTIFYTILAFPLWVAAILFLRSHSVSSVFTFAGWLSSIFYPASPWWFPLFLSSGTFLAFSETMGLSFPKLATSGRLRFIFVLLVGYGAIVGISVYNPRFLRKLDISILPRNSPHYIQTGWTEWIERIRPQLTKAKEQRQPIWTDSRISRDQVQYLLGTSFKVYAPEDLSLSLNFPPQGAFYIREVYLAQIHPEVKFQGRREWISPEIRVRMKELDSTEIFRKGDPIRQFQLYFITPKK